jgi:hypothetical protein
MAYRHWQFNSSRPAPPGHTLLQLDDRDAAVATKQLTYYPDAQDTPEWHVRRKMLAQRRLRRSAARLLKLPAIGGSSVSKFILSAYQDGSPERTYGVARGELDDTFEDNVYMRYGKRYEPRVRAIFTSICGGYDRHAGTFHPTLTVRETGMYRWTGDGNRTNVGVSLDGITNEAVRIRGYTDAAPVGTVAFDWHLGEALIEIKTSVSGLKPAPLVGYVLQMHLQMMVRGRCWCFLVYWHADAVRVWLVRRDDALCRWMLRRIDLATMHVCRGVPLSGNSPFLPWRRYDSKFFYPGATWADYVQWQWTGTGTSMKSATAPPGKPPRPEPRPPLTREHWVDELRQLCIHSGPAPAPDPDSDPAAPPAELDDPDIYWSRDVPGGAETDMADDEQDTFLPPRPEHLYLIYEFRRAVPSSEIDTSVRLEDPVKSHDPYLVDHDPADLAWFAQRFPSIVEYGNAQLALPDFDVSNAGWRKTGPGDTSYSSLDDDGCPGYAPHASRKGPGGHGHMTRLFITSMDAEQPSAAARSERILTPDDDPPDERHHFDMQVKLFKEQRAAEAAAAAAAPPPQPCDDVPECVSAPSKRTKPAAASRTTAKPKARSAKRPAPPGYSLDAFLQHSPPTLK